MLLYKYNYRDNGSERSNMPVSKQVGVGVHLTWIQSLVSIIVPKALSEVTPDYRTRRKSWEAPGMI